MEKNPSRKALDRFFSIN